LDELRAISNAVEARQIDHEARPAAIDSLRRQIELCKVTPLSFSVIVDIAFCDVLFAS
jgi:hypothetical protein